MRVLLVNMPWASVEVPSLALGILRGAVRRTVPSAQVDVLHANLDYVDWLVDHTEFTLRDYQYFSLHTYFSGCGDWVFTSAMHDDPHWRVEAFTERVAGQMSQQDLELTVRLHRLAGQFIETLAEQIVAAAPDVVGFTTTFQQNTASLAAARAIKARDPRITTVFGGANCDGAQGAAVHRNFDQVDYVVRGEGELTVPQLLRALAEPAGPARDTTMAGIAGLCWADRDGRRTANPMGHRLLPATQIAEPDYDGYFERLAASRASQWVEPRLVVEGSRGCWWGQRHQCTFCGLNGSAIDFRSKAPDRLYDEIIALVARHQVLDMFMVDNILDMGYLSTLLPRLAEAGHDLRLQYEIKANMRSEQVATLASAGVVAVQPGIESLSSRVLQTMNKGVTGCQNVRLLRDAESNGVSVFWNYLYGFPGEVDADYLDLLDQLPALHHLAPPTDATRIAIERFSPYFDRPELGFADLRPAGQYRLNYDLPATELMDMAYLFEAPHRGIGNDLGERLGEQLRRWRLAYFEARLTYCELGEEILLVNRREAYPWRVLRLRDADQRRAFELLAQPRTVAAIAAALRWQPAAVEELLLRWRGLGIVFAEGGQFVHLAAVATNQDLVKIDHLRCERDAGGSDSEEPGAEGPDDPGGSGAERPDQDDPAPFRRAEDALAGAELAEPVVG